MTTQTCWKMNLHLEMLLKNTTLTVRVRPYFQSQSRSVSLQHICHIQTLMNDYWILACTGRIVALHGRDYDYDLNTELQILPVETDV